MHTSQAFSSPTSDSVRSSPRQTSAQLDRYAQEFAILVRRHEPRRGDDEVIDWMRGLPDEVFRYYRRGIGSYGRSASRPDEQRGRLYLTHTALLFMWMSWGKSKARARFRDDARKATRRVANLAMLEQYRRDGVLLDYSVGHWFWSPVEQWGLVLNTEAVDADRITDANLAGAIGSLDTVAGTVDILASLRQDGALRLAS